MKYRDYAVLTFLTFLIELSISCIMYQNASPNRLVPWSTVVSVYDLDIVFGATVAAFAFFCVKAYQEHKMSDNGSKE